MCVTPDDTESPTQDWIVTALRNLEVSTTFS